MWINSLGQSVLLIISCGSGVLRTYPSKLYPRHSSLFYICPSCFHMLLAYICPAVSGIVSVIPPYLEYGTVLSTTTGEMV